MKKGNFNGDAYDDLAIVHHWGKDINGDNIKDNSMMVVLNGNNGSTMFSHHPYDQNSGGYNCYLIEVGDFNGDGNDEIAHARHSSGDLNGDGFADGTFLRILNGNGSTLWGYSYDNGISGLESTDGIYIMKKGNFNGDAYDDLAIVHHWGKDINGDNIKDNSMMVVLNGNNSSTMFYYHPFDQNVGGYGCYLMAIADNDITNEELVRSLTTRRSITELYAYFLDKDNFPIYNTNTQGDEMGNIDDYYTTLDYIKQIRDYSTTYCMENYPGVDEHINNASTACVRLNRIASTFLYRTNRDDIDFESFRYGIKSMISHLNWTSMKGDNHYNSGSNHGIVFELPYYIKAASMLVEFKDYGTWKDIAETRLDNQMDHILTDGMHDEHSLNYNWAVAYMTMKIRQFLIDNPTFIGTPSLRNLLGNKAEQMYEYFLYVVKPIAPLIPNGSDSDGITDLPVTGDSYGILSYNYEEETGNFGKRSQGASSILMYPIDHNHTSGWSLSLLDQLRFAAKDQGQGQQTVPTSVSKKFDAGETFIFRSNWENASGEYDYNARYCLFKAGEMQPASTTSHHCHADLLSVDVSAYGHNIVVDPGGYVASGYAANTVSVNEFEQLYGRSPVGSSGFEITRQYFKGTAAHNTVYINNNDQALYVGEYEWKHLDELNNLGMESISEDEYDFVTAKYSNAEAAHKREILYVKPKNTSGDVEFDYWVFSDIINFAIGKQGITQQVWHPAPEQNVGSSSLNGTTGVLTGNNFWLLPIKNTTAPTTGQSMIDGYYFHMKDPTLSLTNVKIVKYTKSSAKNHVYLTVLFPSNSTSGQIPPTITKTKVYHYPAVWLLATDFQAQGCCLNYTVSGNSYKDCIFISHLPGVTFYWDHDNNSRTPKIYVNARVAFRRYRNSSLIKSFTIYESRLSKSMGHETLQSQIPNEFKLMQNYPNPFNPSTVINYSLKEKRNVKITVFDIMGNEIKQLIYCAQEAGFYSVTWDGTNNYGERVASGVYIYRLEAGDFTESRKMMLIR